LAEGIFPYRTTECSDWALKIDVEYDQVRPKHIADLGISRQNTVYAHPVLAESRQRLNGGWLNRAQERLAVLTIRVADMEQAFVCDGLLNAYPHTAEEYWCSLTTLANYRKQPEPTFNAPSPLYEGKYTERYLYMWPEVLLPNGVEPDMIVSKTLV
jgi:hypothetical protein